MPVHTLPLSSFVGASWSTKPGFERLFLIDVLAFDWNCPKYITPRYTAAEVEHVVAPLRQRIAELEAQLKSTK